MTKFCAYFYRMFFVTRKVMLCLSAMLWVTGFARDLQAKPFFRKTSNLQRVDNVRFSFLALGDTGQKDLFGRTPAIQLLVGEALIAEHRAQPVDLLIFLGDNFYDADDPAEIESRLRVNFARPYCDFLASDAPLFAKLQFVCEPDPKALPPVPLLAVLGNHDFKSATARNFQCKEMKQYISNWNPMCEVVDVVEHGGVSLILYDSQRMQIENRYTELSNAIAASQGPWRILIAHKPIEADAYGEKILNAISSAGVSAQLHLAGHDHNLQIAATPSSPILLQAIAGSGGEVREVRTPLVGTEFVGIVPGFVRVDITRGLQQRLVVSAFEAKGSALEARKESVLRSRWSVTQKGKIRNELD